MKLCLSSNWTGRRNSSTWLAVYWQHSGTECEVGLRFPEHTAVFTHEQRGEFVGAAREELRGGQQFLDALGDGRVAPAGEGLGAPPGEDGGTKG
nr:hypothetical protein [Streptomyces sp.]